MSQPTEHGHSVSEELYEDAYGHDEPLTLADVWLIVDGLHTHFMENETPEPLAMFSRWLRELEAVDSDLPPM